MSEELQARIDAVVAKYEPELQQLQAEGERIGDDAMDPGTVEAMINVDFTIDWKDQEIIFDLPAVTMRRREISFDLPQVTMKRQRIVFDKPVTRMEMRCLFKKPVFRGTKVSMKCVYGKFPVLTMERHEIIYDIPEVRMERKEMAFDVPEFSMNRQRWVVRLPQFTVTNIKAATRRLQDKGEELQRRGEDIARRMEQELQQLLAGGQQIAATADDDSREAVEADFNAAIAALENSIAGLVAQGVDPIKVPTDEGDLNLRKELSDMIAARDQALAQLDADAAVNDDEPAGEPIAA